MPICPPARLPQRRRLSRDAQSRRPGHRSGRHSKQRRRPNSIVVLHREPHGWEFLVSFSLRNALRCDNKMLVLRSFRRLHLNDKHYFVEPPKREKISSEEITKLGDVRSLVAQVRRTFSAWHVMMSEPQHAANQQMKTLIAVDARTKRFFLSFVVVVVFAHHGREAKQINKRNCVSIWLE